MLTTRVSGTDRLRLMKRAAAARAKGRHKRAIALYRKVLEREPDNPALHKKLAPLYAKTKQGSEALASYQVAAEGLVRQGFNDQAIGLLRGAVGQLPTEATLWQSVAELELLRGRRVDAVAALVAGRGYMRKRNQRVQAIELLSRARKINPSDFRVSYDLARLLGKTGRHVMAMHLLEELAARPEPKQLARVRGLQFRLSPGPGTLGRYLRALALGH
jgi:tetratricopeptide (TPR) repeat protein